MAGLDDLVDLYLERSLLCGGCYELIAFRELSLDDAVSLAALSEFHGKRHPHQRRLLKNTLLEARVHLLDALPQLRAVANFEELHGLVSTIMAPIWGAGPLYVYDVAQRIGVCLSLEPAVVYLHAGAREGARHLGIYGDRAPLSAFPKAIQRLTPGQAEDFLCNFKGDLARAATLYNS